MLAMCAWNLVWGRIDFLLFAYDELVVMIFVGRFLFKNFVHFSCQVGVFL